MIYSLRHYGFSILLFLVAVNLKAQSELYGKWKASCVFERKDPSSIQFCDICPDKIINGLAMIDDFNIEINAESLKIINEEKGTEVKYVWDVQKETIRFTYNNKEYQFKLLTMNDNEFLILKHSNGSLLHLRKLH